MGYQSPPRRTGKICKRPSDPPRRECPMTNDQCPMGHSGIRTTKLLIPHRVWLGDPNFADYPQLPCPSLDIGHWTLVIPRPRARRLRDSRDRGRGRFCVRGSELRGAGLRGGDLLQLIADRFFAVFDFLNLLQLALHQALGALLGVDVERSGDPGLHHGFGDGGDQGPTAVLHAEGFAEFSGFEEKILFFEELFEREDEPADADGRRFDGA
jgi:hypothetical protein